MRAAVAANPDYPSILFVYVGDVENGQSFFSNAWPEAKAIADKEQVLYTAFNVTQGSWSQMFGVGVVMCGLRATSKGNVQGRTAGDPWQMPGAFVVQGERVLWQHDFAHVGDQPDWGKIPGLAEMKLQTSDVF